MFVCRCCGESFSTDEDGICAGCRKAEAEEPDYEEGRREQDWAQEAHELVWVYGVAEDQAYVVVSGGMPEERDEVERLLGEVGLHCSPDERPRSGDAPWAIRVVDSGGRMPPRAAIEQALAALSSNAHEAETAETEIAEWDTLAAPKWLYDDTGYHAYVMLSGEPKEVDRVERLLQQAGLSCTLRGPSVRPAADGRQYEWLIRVSESDGRIAPRAKVAQALSVSGNAPERGDAGVPAAECFEEADFEEGYVRSSVKAEAHAWRLERRLEDLVGQVKALEETLRAERAAAKVQEALVHSLYVALEQRPGVVEHDLLRKQVAEQDRIFDQLREREAEFVARIDDRDRIVRTLQDATDDLRRRLVDAESKVDTSRGRAMRNEEIREFLSALLPRMVLVSRSMGFLESAAKRGPALDLLRRLVADRERIRSGLVHGAPPWRKVDGRLDTGPGHSDGRLYYGFRKDGRVTVLLSYKADQERDIVWMREHDPDCTE